MSCFYPELTLGAEALSSRRRQEVGEFLVRVVRDRGFPLHVANLWNALYFGWDPERRQYVAETIEPSRVPRRTMNAREPSLPVGAFLRVQTETRAGDLWGEVIYKEGADVGLSAERLPTALCGKPRAQELDGRQTVVARERFVLDLGAFGKDQNEISPAAYERLLRHARWLDKRGHLVAETVYEPDEAGLEDVDHYVNYLIDNHRDGLLAFCFTERPDEEELREGLIGSFRAVRDIALDRRELRSWRGRFFFDADRYDDQVSTRDSVPLGASDLSYLYRSLARTSEGLEVAYAAIGPRLDDFFSSDGYDHAEESLMLGPAYAQTIVHANTYLCDRLAEEAPDGLLDANVNLRLDDDWQGGGIWRCERLEEPSSITRLPADLPLHLGLAEADAVSGVDEDRPPDDAEPEATTVHGFTIALTHRDLAAGRLRMPPRIVDALARTAPVTLRLRHDGETTSQPAQVDRAAGKLTEVPWPPSLYPGVKVYGNVERGGAAIKARTEALIEPVTIDGAELRYEFVKSVYEREVGEPELPPAERQRTTSPRDLVCRAFRLYGRQAGEDGKALTYRQILRAVMGPGARASESQALASVIDAMDLDRDGADYVWRPRVTRSASVSDSSVLAAYGEDGGSRRRLPGIVRRRYVPMHLRHMRRRGVSNQKISSYSAARIEHGMQGLLPETLPAGYTWVEPYELGADDRPLAPTPSVGSASDA